MADFTYTILEEREPWYFGEDTLIVKFANLSMHLANQIRRTLLVDLPIVAIESCLVMTNTSSQHDDMISHRIGLIPLSQPLDDVTALSFTLNCQASSVEPFRVMSGHLEPVDHDCRPLYDTIEIVKLYPGEQIQLVAVAVKGQGTVHAKHYAAHAFYRQQEDKSIEMVVKSLCGIRAKQLLDQAIRHVSMKTS